MQSQIEVLPPLLANQIAAGEVIERPCSVLKELLENSIDAKATHITVDLLSGGLSLIKVQDDGLGVYKDDLPKALLRHATSKIKRTQDLMHIASLGFRGEALASIAACAKLIISSKPAKQEQAYQCVLKGYDLAPELKPCALEFGTCVEVRDLFYNIPARRKFLKSAKTELQHCVDVVNKCALANPDITFVVTHNHQNIKRYTVAPSQQLEQRVKAVCSKQFIEKASAVNQNAMNLSIWGFLGDQSLFRRTPDWQFFFVNHRPVKDKLILHAVKSVFHEAGYSLDGLYPSYVLFLTLPFDEVDVNVHPTKHEVRFIQSRHIHDFIKSSLKSALQLSPAPAVSDLAAIPLSFNKSELVTNDTPTPRMYSELTVPLQMPVATTATANQWMLLGNSVYFFKKNNKINAVDLKSYAKELMHWLQEEFPELIQSYPILDVPKYKGKLSVASELKSVGFTISQNIQQVWTLIEAPHILKGQNMQKLFEGLIACLNDHDDTDMTQWIISVFIEPFLNHASSAHRLHEWIQSHASEHNAQDGHAFAEHLMEFFRLGIESNPQIA